MATNITSQLLSSANPYKDRTSEVKPLISKWKRSGLLEGLKSETEVNSMAVLLENQAKQLVKENSMTTAGANAGGYEQWTGVALPLIRRVFAEIAAKEFVSVQPMNLPSGLVFYLDYKYATENRPDARKGFDITGKNQIGTLQGITDTTGDASDGLYGAGQFGYSINQTGSSFTILTTGSANWATFNYDGDFSSSFGTYNTLTVTTGSASTDYANFADFAGVRGFALKSGSTYLSVLPAFTTLNTANNSVTFAFTSSAVTTGSFTGEVVYQRQPTNDNRGDFEAGRTNADLNIPEIDLVMRSIPITAKTRKLKASWTPEFAQDLNAYHSIDAEAELTSMLSEYVSMEIDLEILDMLIQDAATTEFWSAQVGQEWNGSGFAQSAFSGQAYVQGTWFQTLGTKLQKVSNKIHQKTLRGGANFLVCSPDVATVIESIPGYAADTDGNSMKFAMGVQKVGALNSRYQVYKNPYMQENTILMGFRGNQFLETGAVYAPYIPLMLTPLVYDPVNFQPRRGVMTRYAKLTVRPEFYGKVYVSGLQTV